MIADHVVEAMKAVATPLPAIADDWEAKAMELVEAYADATRECYVIADGWSSGYHEASQERDSAKQALLMHLRSRQ